MTDTLQFTGIHHLSSISGDIQQNKLFYTGDLGMRLVKRTVNQDDTSAYHLFYADKVGTPGTDMTFFDYPARRFRPGNNSISRTGLRVDGHDSLEFWAERLTEHGIEHGGITERDGRELIDFSDPEGLALSLVDDGGGGTAPVPWEASPVPAEHQIRGLGPITLTIPDLRPTDLVLQRALNMRPVREYMLSGKTVFVYEMGEGGGPDKELHVHVRPELKREIPGAGAVHHVAFRTPDEAGYDAWAERLNSAGIQNSGKVDRYYFRSLYFREPNGILFEIATDEPGFGVDEPLESLGEKTILPPRFEPRREQILAGLKPID